MMKNLGALLVVVCFVLSAGAVRVRAQAQVTGDVTGTITDPAKAAVVGAKITLKNANTGGSQDGQTNSEGVFRFSLLEPSEYAITVNASGFQTTTQKVTVHVGQVTTLSIQLVLAGSTSTVVVSELAPLLQTENGNAAATLTQVQIQQIPNPGNDVYNILFMAPGAIVPRGGSFPSVYGLPTSSNMVTLNGMEDIDPFNNATNGGASNLLLGLNEVQEATVVTNGYTGEYGTLAGSNTSIMTKSGSNAFHGRGTWYWSGRALDANNFFNNATATPRPFENANQWAGDIGGPILKNKLFFYFNSEGIRVVLPPASSETNIPSPQFEAATIANLNAAGLSASVPFYNSLFAFYNSANGSSRSLNDLPPGSGTVGGKSVTTGNGCGTFTGNPAFVGAGAAPCAVGFRSVVPNFNPEHIESFRIDYNMRTNDRLFFHYFRDNGVQATYTDPLTPIFNVLSNQPSWNTELAETHAFNPRVINELKIGAEWYNVKFGAANFASVLAKMPVQLSFGDGSFYTVGQDLSGFPQGRGVTSAEIADDLSWEIGPHALKFGVLFTRWDITDYLATTRSMSVATLDAFYNGGFDPAEVSQGSKAVDATSYTQSFPLSGSQPFAMYRLGGYAQDQWKLRPNFSLTFALRLDHASNPICRKVCFARLSTPFLAGGDTLNTAYNQAISANNFQSLPDMQSLEWQPRLGFAWQPRGTSHATVIRGGVGIFYDSFPVGTLTTFVSNPPNLASFQIAKPTFGYISPAQTTGSGATQLNPLVTDAVSANQAFQTAFTSGATLAQLTTPGSAQFNPLFKIPNLTASDPKLIMPQYQKWSLEVQQGLWRNASVTVGYEGDHGIHTLLSIGGFNAYSPTGSFAGLPTAPLNPLFNVVTYLASEGTSNYNGMTVSFQQRFSRGLVQLNYTWSHAIDLGFGTGQSRTIEDPYLLSRSIGDADQDVRHYANANYVWELPINKLFRGRGWDRAVNGWQVSGTVFLRTGFPFSVTDSTDTTVLAGNGYGGATLLGNFVGSSIPGGCGDLSTANKLAATPVSCLGAANQSKAGTNVLFTKVISGGVGTFGTSSRDAIRGPGLFDTDFSLMKNTRITERVSLNLGVQFYNVFNHPNFQNPGSTLTTASTFGFITTALGPGSSVYGSGLGGDSSPRIGQLKIQVSF